MAACARGTTERKLRLARWHRDRSWKYFNCKVTMYVKCHCHIRPLHAATPPLFRTRSPDAGCVTSTSLLHSIMAYKSGKIKTRSELWIDSYGFKKVFIESIKRKEEDEKFLLFGSTAIPRRRPDQAHPVSCNWIGEWMYLKIILLRACQSRKSLSA